MTKKGLYKLATRPHIFLRDYVNKKQRKFEYLIPKKKVEGVHQYTVVSAVYNVEVYLDDYFKSLVYQSLDFEKHIHLVLVDDGSPDNSSDTIKKWQEQYPNNITYIKKENGGQASARNLGMDFVKTEWVTFIDPDDFVDGYYFEEIDTFLVENSEISFSMLACNFIFFHEKGGKISDTHPLKYKFHQGKQIVSVDKMEGKIQLSASTALFKMSNIRDNHILFNDKIRPSFEDAHFIGIYLIYTSNSSIGFIKKSKYFYRKRAESTSTLDTGWQMPSAFDDVLRIGCLGLFQESIKTKGYVTKELQKTILYHLIWQFKKIVNNPSSVSFLSPEQQETYKALLKELFQYIDFETIDSFNLAGAWFYHKVALLGVYKKERYSYQILYIDAYDSVKNELKVRYFSYFDTFPLYTFSGREALPLHSKIRKHDFLGEQFVNEHITWVPLGEKGVFNAFIDNRLTHLSLGGKHWIDGIDIEFIKKYFSKKSLNSAKFPIGIRAKRKLYQNHFYTKKFHNVWLFMDREHQADDNAEHLYRYIMYNHPNINIFYIIKKESPEWSRLKKDGFNLIDFGSVEHEASLIHAKHMISSDAVKYITNYLPNQYYKDLLSYKFTFLQHGVTKDDLSAWLNTKTIDCFVTAAIREYDSIAGDNNKYKFTSKELFLTGFPRHDNLLKNNHNQTKIIMIMPTWREYLNELDSDDGDNTFKETPFGRAWSSLLYSDFLKNMSEKEGYTLLFFPHPNIKKFLNEFEMPSYIEVLLEQKESIQTLFQTSDLLLTDYSSVAFEMAILNKQTIYYQFDHQEIFAGAHTYEKGYFDYSKDAFGPICYDEKSVIDELKRFLESGEVDAMYQQRMQHFFAYQDTDNAKRTFEAIESLYHPRIKEISDEQLLEKAEEALNINSWKAIESRYEQLLERKIAPTKSLLILSRAKYFLGKIDASSKLLDRYIDKFGQTDEAIELYNSIKTRKKLLDTLDRRRQLVLLVNEEEDFLTTLTYKNINQWFRDKEWHLLNVATKLIDKQVIVKKNLGYFYYICVVTANELEKREDALSYLPLVREY
jgi:CDP-glycerol glycerophosphotransferase (TagB/SpsB family)